MASISSFVSFFKQVRSEAVKVTWPSRRETLISMVFVIVMVMFMAFFLFLSDKVIELGIWGILHLFDGSR